MMKTIKFIFAFLIIFTIGCINVKADPDDSEVGGQNQQQNTTVRDDDGTFKLTWSKNFPGSFGIKVTVYKKDGTEVSTQYFINDEDQVSTLESAEWNKKTIKTRNGGYDRLNNRYDSANNNGTWKKPDKINVKYLNFSDLVVANKKGYQNQNVDYSSIVNLLKNAGSNAKEIIKNLGLSGVDSSLIRNLVLVIEPAVTFYRKSDSAYYFGTYWDFMNLVEQNKSLKSYAKSINEPLGKSIIIKNGTLSESKTPEIMKFLDNFPLFKQELSSKDMLGVSIMLLKDIIPGNDILCNTSVELGSCSDYYIKEPTDEQCVVNNSKYIDSTVRDCGGIYCSKNISTDISSFKTTFSSIIRSGGYFKMNSLKMEIKKICYLKQSSSSNSCNDWYNQIKKENAGTINLSLISAYTLIEDSSKTTVDRKCVSKSNGKCLQAEFTQTIEYALEPNVNRFISIKEMAGTATSSGDNIVDLGGEHLTTPISLSTGKHNYTLDYNNSILSDSITRLTKNTINNVTDTIIYNYNQLLTSGDLIYSCDYTVKNSDEICPEGECCEGNKIVGCPINCVCDSITGCDENCNPLPEECDCAGECCDSNCKVVECADPDKEPGGFPNVVYRPINLIEAFPGQNGIGRDFGSNWYGYAYDSNGNTINKPNGTPYTKEEYYVNYNRGYNDYDVYQSEPLYVIKLDYDALKEIREYNDANGHDYNDFTLTCTNGESCISNFLRGNVNGFDRNLITGGTCKNINSSTFDSCISRRGA